MQSIQSGLRQIILSCFRCRCWGHALMIDDRVVHTLHRHCQCSFQAARRAESAEHARLGPVTVRLLVLLDFDIIRRSQIEDLVIRQI